MPSIKEVKNRIGSVKSTQQLTKAMKMVAAAKLKKAQDKVLQLRPYSKKLNEIFKDGNLSASSIEYTRELISKRIASRDLNPASIVSYKSDEEFFADTGYSHPISGYMDIVQKIDIVDIQRHLKKIISINNSNRNGIIFICFC